MKRLYFKFPSPQLSIALMVVVFFTAISCTDIDESLPTASGPPSLDRVSGVAVDTTVTVGRRNTIYVIHGNNLLGTQAVYFNGVEAFFNPTLVTNDNIIIRVPDDAPYFDAEDELVVETTQGSATLPFMIAQPPPRITGFTPLAAGAGEIVTITGTIFEGLESVRFGDVEAEIVSSTNTEIQVRVPEGIVQSFIWVETAGGEVRSTQSFGFKLVLYDDSLAPGWWEGSWNTSVTPQSTEQVKRGEFAAKVNFTSGYAGFQIGNGGAAINLGEYSAIKFSIYATQAGRVRLSINGLQNSNAGVVLELEEGVWNDFTVPFSEFTTINGGIPFGTLDTVVIQEFSGAAHVIYVDDLGLI